MKHLSFSALPDPSKIWLLQLAPFWTWWLVIRLQLVILIVILIFSLCCFQIVYAFVSLSTVRFAKGGMCQGRGTCKAKLVKQERFIKASEGDRLSTGWHQPWLCGCKAYKGSVAGICGWSSRQKLVAGMRRDRGFQSIDRGPLVNPCSSKSMQAVVFCRPLLLAAQLEHSYSGRGRPQQVSRVNRHIWGVGGSVSILLRI